MNIHDIEKKYLIIIISSIIGLTVISITIIATFLNFQPLGINNDVTNWVNYHIDCVWYFKKE
jgi:hypothetical protein